MSKEPCPYCHVCPGKRHEDWCPCSAVSRRFVRSQYLIGDEEGHHAFLRLVDAAAAISGAGRS